MCRVVQHVAALFDVSPISDVGHVSSRSFERGSAAIAAASASGASDGTARPRRGQARVGEVFAGRNHNPADPNWPTSGGSLILPHVPLQTLAPGTALRLGR